MQQIINFHRGFALFLTISVFILLAPSLDRCTSETPLEGTNWILSQLGDDSNPDDVIEGTEITALFQAREEQVSGSGGCNSYFASYEINDNEISIASIASTLMHCSSPEGIMAQESRYYSLLGSAISFEVSQNQLNINCSDNQILVYETE